MTWTTDAIYRETRSRVGRRVAEGCLTVEMEAAALIAVSKFYRIPLAQLLYAGDSLAGDEWAHRSWLDASAVRKRLVDLAITVAARLDVDHGSPVAPARPPGRAAESEQTSEMKAAGRRIR